MLYRLCLLYFIGFFLLASNSFSSSEKSIVQKSEAEAWVESVQLDIPEQVPHEEIEGGIYYLLVDDQIKVDADSSVSKYKRRAELMANQRGIETSSQVTVSFDPAYQKLVLNSLKLIRSGQTIDKLPSAKVTVIQREPDLENLIYDGRLTANIILEDVRVGDILDYSYTITGSNPVYNNIFSYSRYFQWSVPVHRQIIRLLWGKETKLHFNHLNKTIVPRENKFDDFKEYRIDLKDEPPLSVNSQTPKWYDPYGKVYFSELASWAEVVSWALTLYENVYATNSQITDIVDNIKKDNESVEDQIVAALQFVQSEIRYLGLELGVNSHRPSLSTDTLERRYGDCKDKTVLLITLLSQLGVKAYPALVNTKRTEQILQYPPILTAFNHVLVKVQHQGSDYWLDPTRLYQQGGLSNIFQPNYGAALVIKNNSQTLETMNTPTLSSSIVYKDQFDLSQGTGKPANFNTKTKFIGYQADTQRFQLAQDGIAGLQERYLHYYSDLYQSASVTEKIKVQTDQKTGDLILEEHYLLEGFWYLDEKRQEYTGTFTGDMAISYIPKPNESQRNGPYALIYPLVIQQEIIAQFAPENWAFEDEQFIEDNEYFFYQRQVQFDEKTKQLTILYDLTIKQDHVPAENIKAFIDYRNKILDHGNYSVSMPLTLQDTEENTDDFGRKLIPALAILYLFCLVFMIISLFRAIKLRPTQASTPFYPMSLIKLYVLSVMSMGLYQLYWFYRNWTYVKLINKSSIMPFWRSFFSIFWYYPFYTTLVTDSQQRYGDNRVFIKSLAMLFALSYFMLQILSSFDILFSIGLVISPLLLLPMANYINHIEGDQAPYYRENSTWAFRHILALLIFLPLTLLTFGIDVNLLPSEKIIKGDRIWNHDLNYIYRKKIIPPEEKIQYFYSDALLSIRDDGNGFSENYVFSFWKESDELYVESEHLSQVAKIEPVYSTSWNESTIVTITRADGSEFVLYLSKDKGLDKVFVKTLTNNWQAAKEH